MSKTYRYIRTYSKHIILAVILGQGVALWLTKYLFSKSWLKDIIALDFSWTFALLVALSILTLFYALEPIQKFYIRYRNSYNLQEIPLGFADILMFFIVSWLLATLFLIRKDFADISVPVLLWITGLCLTLFGFGHRIRKRSRAHLLSSDVFPNSGNIVVFSDSPISREDDDLLERKKFVQDFYDQIVNFPEEDSFVFSLHGAWGEGKTSVVNLLRNRLNVNESLIVFDFDPWFYSSQEALIKGFYDGLYSSINMKFSMSNLKRLVRKYVRLLSIGVKILDFSPTLRLDEGSLENVKKDIESSILLVGKKIVVIIDDIDRVRSKEEILQIFKIVKLSGNFKKTIFILSFDHKVVQNSLGDLAAVDDAFLEKIIQQRVNLPSINQDLLDRFLFSALDRLLKKLDISEDQVRSFKEEFVDLYNNQLYGFFNTLRRIKIYLNALYSTLPAVKTEVSLRDFLMFEIIRVFFRSVYDDIWSHRWYYIKVPWNIWFYDTGFAEEEKYKEIRRHVEEIANKELLREELSALLRTLFPVVDNAFKERKDENEADSDMRVRKRVAHPDVFPKYFILSVPPDELSDEFIEALIESWNRDGSDAPESKVGADLSAAKSEQRAVKLLNKLLTFSDKITPDAAKALVRAIYKNIELFSKDDAAGLWTSEFRTAELLMLHVINKKVPDSGIQPLLEEIIDQVPSYSTAASTLNSARKERGGNLYKFYDNVNISALETVYSLRLSRELIEQNKNIFEAGGLEPYFVLAQWARISSDDKRKMNKYVFTIAEGMPMLIGKIIAAYMNQPDGYQELINAYDEEGLNEVLRRHYANAFSNDDERDALQLFTKTYDARRMSQ